MLLHYIWNNISSYITSGTTFAPTLQVPLPPAVSTQSTPGSSPPYTAEQALVEMIGATTSLRKTNYMWIFLHGQGFRYKNGWEYSKTMKIISLGVESSITLRYKDQYITPLKGAKKETELESSDYWSAKLYINVYQTT